MKKCDENGTNQSNIWTKTNTGNQNRRDPTITDALTTCGVLSDTTGMIVNGNNTAEMIDADAFNYNLNTCVNIKFSKL